MTKPKSLKEGSDRKENLMAEEKNEMDASCDTCNKTNLVTRRRKRLISRRG
jgi:hypothetical protein